MSRAIIMALLLLACTDTVSDPIRPLKSAVDEGDYIVTVTGYREVLHTAAEHGITPTRVYRHAVRGFAAHLTPDQVAALRSQGARVHRDSRISIAGPTPTWGTDRIDQRAPPLDGIYTPPGRQGAGVTIYIVDTGVWPTHEQFTGRASVGFDAFGTGPFGKGIDCHGHGTHVSGTAVGNTVGVAPKASVVGVRVLDCAGNGSWSTLLAGTDWIAQNVRFPCVVNFSLGEHTGVDDPTHPGTLAIERLVALGCVVSVAGGNFGLDACGFVPANARSALTMAASAALDIKAWFTNVGPCIDWFAPGLDIFSSMAGADNRYVSASGTSMSAPHTAGAAALVLGEHPHYTPAQVRSVLFAALTKNVIRTNDVENNHLLYVYFDSLGTVPDTPAPPVPPAPPSIDQDTFPPVVGVPCFVRGRWVCGPTEKRRPLQ